MTYDITKETLNILKTCLNTDYNNDTSTTQLVHELGRNNVVNVLYINLLALGSWSLTIFDKPHSRCFKRRVLK